MTICTSKYPYLNVSPEQVYWMAKAPYESNPKAYLKKHDVGVICDSTGSADGFDFILCRITATNAYAIAFRGTATISNDAVNCTRNWINNVADFIVANEGILKRIRSIVDKWAQKVEHRGSWIEFMIGHSRGGAFASHVKRSWQPVRITLNGHGIIKEDKAGNRLVNLRLSDDPVTHRVNHTKYCITIGKGGHSLEDFKDLLRNRTWQELTSGKVDGARLWQLHLC